MAPKEGVEVINVTAVVTQHILRLNQASYCFSQHIMAPLLRHAANAAAATCAAVSKLMLNHFATMLSSVTVLQNEGFLCHIQLHSKLDVPRDAAYQMVVDPDNYRYFRNVTVSNCTTTCSVVESYDLARYNPVENF